MKGEHKNILVLTYWSYNDALVQTYTLPYVRIIRKIISPKYKLYLVTFDSSNYAIDKPEQKRIKQELLNEGIHWVRFHYFPLSIKAISSALFSVIKLFLICIFRRINSIHAWCTPAGTLGYVLSKTTGTSLVIDSYEPHAEAMVENGTWGKTSFAFKLLFYFEKKMSHYASVLIAASSGMRKYAEEKYNLKNKKIYIKPACIDYDFFSDKDIKNEQLLNQFGLKNKIVCVYAGKFGGIYLEKEVFDFLKVAHDYWKEKFHVLLLTDSPQDKIYSLANQSGLDTKIITVKFIPHKDIAPYLGLGDFAINPVKPVPTKKYCTSIKDGEYWAMGLPVVITKNISDDSAIIEENDIGAVLHNLNEENYLSAIKKIDILLNSPSLQKKKEEIRNIAKRFRGFEVAEKIYQEIYE